MRSPGRHDDYSKAAQVPRPEIRENPFPTGAVPPHNGTQMLNSALKPVSDFRNTGGITRSSTTTNARRRRVPGNRIQIPTSPMADRNYDVLTTYREGLSFSTRFRGKHEIVTDQPAPDGGDAGPMPTELLLASLGTCVGHYVVEKLQQHGIPTEGLTVRTDAEKAEDLPPRFSKLIVRIDVPAEIPEKKRKRVQKTAEACFVHHTLSIVPEIAVDLRDRTTV